MLMPTLTAFQAADTCDGVMCADADLDAVRQITHYTIAPPVRQNGANIWV